VWSLIITWRDIILPAVERKEDANPWLRRGIEQA